MTPVLLHWDLLTPVDLETAWRAFSNTDRFNRACGLGFSFKESPQPDGTVLRTGTARKFGLALEWQELPFEIRAPTAFTSRRIFPSGPLARLTTSVELEERPDGTGIAYTVDLEPRMTIFRPLVALDAATTTRPLLDRTLTRLLRSLEGKDELDPPPPLSRAAAHRLREWAARSRTGAAVERLISNAPLDVQDRLRPLQVAASERIPEQEAIARFLDGVEQGVLELRWELLCPSCRAPKDHAPRLGDGPREVHCPSCNIRYDATFPEAVAITFRPAPGIRSFTVPVDCLLSPARTPHVLAQATLPEGGEVEFEATLATGGYRIDTRPALGGAVIEVRDGLPDSDLALDLTDDGVRPRVLRLAPGRRKIAIRSRLGRAALLVLERRWLPPFTLTAGRLLEEEGARALLPPDAVAPGIEVAVARRTVLAAAGLPDGQRTEPALVAAARRAEAASTGDGTAVLAFPSPVDALAALRTLASVPGLSAGLAVGPVATIAKPDGSRIPTGSTVERALDAQRAVGAQRIALHVADKQDPTVKEALGATEGLSIRDPGEYCHLLLGFGQETAELRRERLAKTRSDRLDRCGPFLLGDEIARGAHGRVFAARHQDGREAVVKLLVPELAEDPDATLRFYAEARFTSRLDHPNVVRVLDWGEAVDGRLWMALERLEGEPLDVRLQRGRLPPEDVRRIGLDVLAALEATHGSRILHRDLKPGNLFVERSGRVKVLDFGVAQRLGDDFDDNVTLPGTPEYMSPEQVEADPLDVRSDLYSLGVVLYECAAGQLPFEGDQGFVLAMQRLIVPAKPLRDAAPQVPPPLAEVVMRALELDPPRRWPSALAMRAALVTT